MPFYHHHVARILKSADHGVQHIQHWHVGIALHHVANGLQYDEHKAFRQRVKRLALRVFGQCFPGYLGFHTVEKAVDLLWADAAKVKLL